MSIYKQEHKEHILNDTELLRLLLILNFPSQQ